MFKTRGFMAVLLKTTSHPVYVYSTRPVTGGMYQLVYLSHRSSGYRYTENDRILWFD